MAAGLACSRAIALSWYRNHSLLWAIFHEVVNGFCLAAQRREIDSEALADTLASFDEDFTLGLYRQADLWWRATLNRAAELSRNHSAKLGPRSLDVLHVASARTRAEAFCHL